MFLNKYIVLLCLAIFCKFQNTIGQSISDLKLDNKQSILNNRAFFLFPATAKNTARSTDIMSTDHNINQETRIVLDTGKMRIVFFAQEDYKLGDKDLYQEILKEKNKLGFRTKILKDYDSIISILSTPTTFDSTRQAILVNSLVVKIQDNSIFKINAYINPEAFKLKDEYIKLSEAVFRTLTKGSRINDLSPREEKINIFGTKKDFVISLPQNYCVTVDKKYDFQVIHFHKFTNYMDTDRISLTIYTGNHPSYFYHEYELDEKSAKKVSGKFLEKKIEWLTFRDAEKDMFLKEQMMPSDDIEKDLIVHIAMISDVGSLIDELTKIVEGIKIKR